MNIEIMPMLRVCALVLLCMSGSIAGCGGASPAPALTPTPTPTNVDVDKVAKEVADVERAFAATMAKRDFEAFQSFLSDEAVFFSGPRPLRGKRPVAEFWKRFYEKPAAPFSWEPKEVEVLDSGTLALSKGPVRNPEGKLVGSFSSVWRKEPGGWRIIFDFGDDLPECPASGAASDSAAKADFAAYRQGLIEAQNAYRRKDYAAFLESTQRAATAIPNSPRAIYNVACGYALTDKPTEAIGQLEKLVSMGLYFDATRDDDLASLKNLPQFVAIVDKFAALEKAVVGKSAPAFSVPERDIIAEGIAHDPKTKAFFVSSVHKRKILQILPDGKPKDFATKDLWAVLGMAIDEKRRALWACSSAVPEMKGFTEADKGHAKLVEFDIDTGKLRRTLSLDEPGANHMCNDVAVDPAGNVFVSDPGVAMLYTLPSGSSKLEPYVPPGKFAGPQGIALTSDGKSIFVADYSRGLFHVDRPTHEVTWLLPPNDATLLGIDGLTMYQGDLIAIQNGVRPHRVLRLAVDIAAKSVLRADVLQKNHPDFNEPTLGVVVGKELFYVANSQWGSFEKGVIWPIAKLKEPVILKLALE